MKYQYGAVASGHKTVTEVGLEILRAGGNAFDAIIACGFASSVCEPMLSSLGGGGFLLTHQQNKTQLFDFFTNHSGLHFPGSINPKFLSVAVNFPGSTQHFESGAASIATPGCLHGYFYAHKKLGRLPIRDVIQPTIELAKNGVSVTEFQYYVHQLLTHIIFSDKNSRKIFTQNDQLIPVGEKITNPALADFLDAIAIEGPDLFYRGEVAQTLVNDVQNQGGFLTTQDLENYQTIIRKPTTHSFEDWTIFTNPPPASGGQLIAKLLSEIEKKPPSGDTDKDSQNCWLSHFKSTEAWRKSIEKQRLFSRGTTHVSVIDRLGNCASMTTSNGEGAGYTIADAGIMLNNMMGEDDLHPHGYYAEPAGSRISSMMSPTLAFHQDGRRFALGSGGSKRIRDVMTQILWQLMKEKQPLHAIINQPRLHFDGERLQCEPGFDPVLPDATYWDTRDMYFGGVHIVSNTEPPVGDHRRAGFADFQ
ncbi:gamma-glutamyltransferase [Ostreibacterium oceani]|uniref:Gamma-glutamyltransferase n=1 Tax=Ostreibacterium oceani TaxID=2654998 RepID=A0A6N7ER42_9GAMM|nr:gamma-glutamyltransferase [Ostreibacterium oceani]MPV85334.1 hypothetical protein [Ostreibacterium oceani]